MNYEKIILELMNRIQTLEEQMAMLMNNQNQNTLKTSANLSTDEIRKYILELKKSAKEYRKDTLVLRSGDLHKDLHLKNAMPQVCNAMYQCMEKGDIILHTTPKGKSSTIEIQYNL